MLLLAHYARSAANTDYVAARLLRSLLSNDFTFLVNNGQSQMIKVIITAFKHNTDKKPFEILIDREDTLPFCPIKSLADTANHEGPSRDRYFTNQILHILWSINLTTNFPGV